MMRIEAQINTKMRTLNDPKQAAKLREVLYKFEEQNSKPRAITAISFVASASLPFTLITTFEDTVFATLERRPAGLA